MVRHVIGFRASRHPPRGPMLPSLIAVRALHFWSVAILFGGGGFLFLLGSEKAPSGVRVLRLAASTAALTGLAWFLLTFVNVTGEAGELLQLPQWVAFMNSPFGPPWAAQLALGMGALALCALSRPALFAAVGAALAVDQAWLGHAAVATGGLGVTAVASYATHVLAGFGWIGALTMLFVALRGIHAPADRRTPQTTEVARDGLALFSTIGLFMVAAIFASGCVNAALHMSHVAELTSTPYGRIVLVKIVLFAAMLALAAFNRRGGRRGAMPGLVVSIGLETALGLLVLCAAALLGITAPSS